MCWAQHASTDDINERLSVFCTAPHVVGLPRQSGRANSCRAWVGIGICLAVCACDSPEATSNSNGMATAVEEIANIQPASIEFSQVSNVFSLGGNATDLQRELIHKQLVGSVVRWTVKIYEISSADGGNYRVVSEPPLTDTTKGMSLLHVQAIVTPRSAADIQAMQSAKTGDSIVIKGRVQDIVLRGAVVIQPAILVEAK